MIHVCSQKELFNSLAIKEEEIVKIVDGSACEVIGTGTVKVTERDETMHALEAIWYVPEARYNPLSKGCSTKNDARSKCNKVSSQLAKETG